MLNVLHQKRRRTGQLADKHTRVISQIDKDLAPHIKPVTYVSICNNKNDITGFEGVWNRYQPMLIYQMISFYLKSIFVLCSHIFHHDVLEFEGFTTCLIQFGLFALELVLRCSLFGQVWDTSDTLSDMNVLGSFHQLIDWFGPEQTNVVWKGTKMAGKGNNVCFCFFLPLLRTK